MAVSSTQTTNGGGLQTAWDVIATADADTTATITHGVPFATDALADQKCIVSFEPRDPAYYLSKWVVTSINKTTLVLTKATTASSGTAGVQLRVHIQGKGWSGGV